MTKKKLNPKQPRKLSDIMKEVMERLLRDPAGGSVVRGFPRRPVSRQRGMERVVGVDGERDACHTVWQQIEAEKPDLWDELKSRDIDGMIDELVEYKKAHYPDDRRRILICGGTPHGTIRVEWLPPAAPGVDSKSEMQLYALVRTGKDKEAIRLLKRTRKLSQHEAMLEVATIRMKCGMM